MNDLRSDAELLSATRDPEAFAVFYRRHVRRVMALCAQQVAIDDVGDLVSEVFATALVRRRQFDPERGEARGWLAGIAMHKAADARRQGARRAKTYQRLGGRRLHLPAAELQSDLESEDLLDGLPEQQRRAIRERVFEDHAYHDIAAMENVSADVVRKRVSRALRTLRTRMSEAEQ